MGKIEGRPDSVDDSIGDSVETGVEPSSEDSPEKKITPREEINQLFEEWIALPGVTEKTTDGTQVVAGNTLFGITRYTYEWFNKQCQQLAPDHKKKGKEVGRGVHKTKLFLSLQGARIILLNANVEKIRTQELRRKIEQAKNKPVYWYHSPDQPAGPPIEEIKEAYQTMIENHDLDDPEGMVLTWLIREYSRTNPNPEDIRVKWHDLFLFVGPKLKTNALRSYWLIAQVEKNKDSRAEEIDHNGMQRHGNIAAVSLSLALDIFRAAAQDPKIGFSTKQISLTLRSDKSTIEA